MAKSAYDYPEDIAFKQAARRVLLSQFQKMMDNAPGTRAGDDIEALHDMRVASRRLRAALGLFAKVFSKDDYDQLDKWVGDITDALGLVRDHDVMIDYLRNYRNSLPDSEAYGIGRIIEQQVDKRDGERKMLVKALDKLEKGRFERRFMKILDKAVPGDDTAADMESED